MKAVYIHVAPGAQKTNAETSYHEWALTYLITPGSERSPEYTGGRDRAEWSRQDGVLH